MTITAREPDAVSHRSLHGLVQAIQTPTHFLPALALSACALFISAGAQAQIKPEIANCVELKDEAIVAQAEMCSAHIGCVYVLNVQKTCAQAKGYLERLQMAIGEGTRTFFGSYRKEVTPDAVFTAVLNSDDRKNERKLGGLAEPQRRAHEIEARVRDVGSGETLSGDTDSGLKWVYYGQVKDGKSEGIGTRIISNGEVQRGQFSRNALNGDAEVLSGKGGRFVGSYEKNIRAGQGTDMRPNGSTAIGRWTGNGSMEGTFTRDDGSRFEGMLAGGTFSKGRDYRPNGTLAEEGRYENGKLSVGTQYDMAGVRTEVNLPELARTAQKERIALELARSAAEIEADKQRKREEAARAEQQFRSSLQAMNPRQLFAKADELSAQGDSARAREVQRALMSRFPDHPLTATAARQMAGESGASSATSSNTTSSAGARVTVTEEARGHSATFGPPSTTKRTTGARP